MQPGRFGLRIKPDEPAARAFYDQELLICCAVKAIRADVKRASSCVPAPRTCAMQGLNWLVALQIACPISSRSVIRCLISS